MLAKGTMPRPFEIARTRVGVGALPTSPLVQLVGLMETCAEQVAASSATTANHIHAIVALGDYDPSKGGHLLLWDLKVAVRFPPGALIFLPSAILRHSNVAVGPSERRYSFTQYTAGGLFRWFECGFQSQKAFEAKGNKHRRTGWERWEEGVQRFSTLEELLARGAETRQA